MIKVILNVSVSLIFAYLIFNFLYFTVFKVIVKKYLLAKKQARDVVKSLQEDETDK